MHLPIVLPAPLPLTSMHFYSLILALSANFFSLAWLAQREGTRPIRLALAPAGLGFAWQLFGGVEVPRESIQPPLERVTDRRERCLAATGEELRSLNMGIGEL